MEVCNMELNMANNMPVNPNTVWMYCPLCITRTDHLIVNGLPECQNPNHNKYKNFANKPIIASGKKEVILND